MGRTLPSITGVYFQQLKSIEPFRRGLSRSDQLVLDELFNFVHNHLAEAAFAADALPMQIFLLAILLEEHKEVIQIRQRIEQLHSGV